MLEQSVDILKGVGEKVKEDLALMDLHTIEDILYYFPYRYNIAEVKPLAELVHDDTVTIVGTVLHDPTVSYFGRKKSRLSFNVQVEQFAVNVVMFNRAFAKKQLLQGTVVTLTGKWDAHRLQITVSHYKVGEPSDEVSIQAIYSVKGNIKQARIKGFITQAVENYIQEVKEILPPAYLETYKLPSIQQAIYSLHFPENKNALKHARRRLIYEEFLLFQLKMNYLKHRNQLEVGGVAQQINRERLEQFMKTLPFVLTDAQVKALEEILKDMTMPMQMNRLLQGDVGSGKTVVAAISLLGTVTAGFQGALMVPTEILAEQHYESIQQLLPNLRVALLTSSIKGKKRTAVLESIAQNEVDVVIGTHSLIQEEVTFHSLGLVIIDEQHRFGVEQRRTLREKGLQPDVLFMTATPIPRTLAITAFGDMDVSVIQQLPKGRKEIETYWVKDDMLERVLTFIQKKIAQGEQAYIVSPLIEESEALDYQNAVALYEQLQTYYPAHINIGLLHGKMKNDEKESIMKQFLANDIQILVATTVIEVGVNVPNATVMVIYDAERFGLSQLHQLRGRVGRGDKQSYCILIADPKGEVGKERMKIMTETNDGFKLSEEDLKLRGPGDFFGKKQSGLPEFKVADIVHDYKALEVARNDAQKIIRHNLLFENEEYEMMRNIVEKQIDIKQFD